MRLCQYERVRLYIRLPLCRIRRRSDIHASYITLGAHHFHQSYEAGDRYTAFHQDDVCVCIAIVLTSAHSSTFSSVRGKNLGHIRPGKALQIFEYALGRSGEIQLAVNQERRREK